MSRKTLIIILCLSILANLILAYFAIKYFAARRNILLENKTKQYPLLSPRIFATTQNDLLINFIPLRSALDDYITSEKRPMALYFEYLPTGVSIGINDKTTVPMVSLIKIPVVMAVYKKIEEGKLKQEQILTIKEKELDKNFGSLWKKGVGTKISVREAIKLTLQQSDNTAANLLVDTIGEDAIVEVFDALDIPKLRYERLPLISVKDYSSILRSLYLSSYLQEKDSNEILDILTHTIFKDKLPAGIENSNIKISHKIGTFGLQEDPVYSDCGIIYAPNRPYILCAMVNADEKTANSYISHVSKMIYGYISLVKAR